MAECRTVLAASTGPTVDRKVQARPPQRPLIGMGSGPQGQTYYDIAQNLIDLLSSVGGPPVVNVETEGTFDNLRKLASAFNMTLALAQADVLEAASPDQQRILRVVMPLYLEEIQVLARQDVVRFADLPGKRVLVSDRSSGSAYTTGRLLKLAGVVPHGGQAQALPPVEAVCQVLTGQADALVVVSGQPVGLLRDLGRLAQHPEKPLAAVHFLPLNKSDLQGKPVAGMSSVFYEPGQIARRSYPWAFAPADGKPGADHIPTLAVRAVLMAYDFSARTTPDQASSCDALSRITQVLSNAGHRARLCQLPNHPKWCQLDPAAVVPGWQANTCK